MNVIKVSFSRTSIGELWTTRNFYARVAAAENEPVIIRIVHQRRNLPKLTDYENTRD